MSKKKIAFVIASLTHGGAERVVSNLSNGLIDKFEVVIITFSKSTPFYTIDQRIKVVSCINAIDTPTSIYQSLKLNYKLTKKIYQILKTERVDTVIGFITSANILAIIAAKIHGIPSIISERDNPLAGGLPKFWIIAKKLVYPLAHRVVLQTEGIKKIFAKKIKSEKLTILPNPIASELTNLRDENVKKENLILTVGRLDENKNQTEIIKAFGSIGLTKDWKLLIIGDGHKKQELTDLIHSLNLTDKVEIISKVKRIDKYYNKASIFVFTSKTEGFPNALLEAMHFGLPSISTECNFGPSDLINDGVNGFLVPINQEKILKERLSQLINNPELRLKFSNKAQMTTENYRSEKVIAKWEELINSILKISK